MSEITTVEVTIEVIKTTEVIVKWEINNAEFEEWAGKTFERAESDDIQEFIESSRYYDQEIRDHLSDVDAMPSRTTDIERKIKKVTI